MLKFKDFIEFKLIDQEGKVVKNATYKLKLPDGKTKEGKLDQNGYVKIEDIPPGKYKLTFPDIKGVNKI